MSHLRDSISEIPERIRTDGKSVNLLEHVSLAVILHWIDFLIGMHGSVSNTDQGNLSDPKRISETPGTDIGNQIRNEIENSWRLTGNSVIGEVLKIVADEDVPIVFDKSLLIEILELFNQYSLRESDDRREMREMYESLLLDKRSRDAAFSFFTTPDSVGDLLVELVDPKPDERIDDPCFGIGDLLVKAVRHTLAITSDSGQTRNTTSSNPRIFGGETNPLMFLISLTRIVLAGIDNPFLEWGDSLVEAGTNHGSDHLFDCIISHPPFGVRSEEERTRWAQNGVLLDHIESAFLRHIMLSLKSGGRAAVLLPDRMFSRNGTDTELRRRLLHEFTVEGFISLPHGTNSSHPGIDSSIVYFRKAESRERVWVQKAQPVRQAGSRIAVDSTAEAEVFRSRLPCSICWFVSRRDLLYGDFNKVRTCPGHTSIQHISDTLSQFGTQISITSLSKIGRVFKGRIFGTEHSATVRDLPSRRGRGEKDMESSRPFLRSVDIRDGDIRHPTDTVSPQGTPGIRKSDYLRTGDLVTNRIGTVRKIAVVPENLNGAVPSSNVCVIRLTDVIPQYLRMILLSEPYETWIGENAVGAGIRHISIRALQELPIPVPTREHQLRLSRDLPYHATADELISLFLHEEEPDEVVAYVFGSAPLSHLINDSENKTFLDESAETLSLLTREMQSVCTGIKEVDTSGKPIHKWFIDLAVIVADLADTIQLPPGAERLARISEIKQGWIHRIEHIGDIDERYSQRIRRIARSIRGIMDLEIEKLLSLSRLVGGIEPPVIEADKETEINVTIRNEGVLAVWRLSVKTTPVESTYEVPVLQAGQAVSWTVKISPLSSNRVPILLTWKALRFDRTEMSGEIPLVIGVSDSGVEQLRKLGASPYVVGRPVDTEKDFFGRRNVIADIKRQIEGTGPSNLILFEGIRRSGKTSVLKYMIKQRIMKGWIPSYYSFQSGEGHTGTEGISTREIYRGIAREVILTILRSGYTAEIVEGESISGSSLSSMRTVEKALSRYFVDDQPFRSFEILLLSVLERIQPLGLVLMLDEFDKLQVSIDNGLASAQVPENLRCLFHAHENINAIITGSKRLKHLRNDYMSALFGLGYAIRLEPLNYEDSRRLIEEPVSTDLIYVDLSLQLIVKLCAGHPFLIQSLCNRIFEYCARSGEKIVQPGMVEESAKEMVQDNEHFRTLWDHIDSDKRRFILLVMRKLSDESARVTHDALTARLEGYGVFPEGDESLGDSLAHLQDLELVGYEGTASTGFYTLAIPLIGLWLDTHIDFEDYRQRAQRELERV